MIHGVDYNGNGQYDFEGAGTSEIASSRGGSDRTAASSVILPLNGPLPS